MLNRRELIASSVALSLTAPVVAARPATHTPPSAGGPPSGETPSAQGFHVTLFVADSALPEAREAAAVAAARGERIDWIGRDLTPVYTRLDLALRPQPFAVAGVTSARDFFVLERLAWDRGLRTVTRRALNATSVEWRLEPRARR